jgi:hypothetical protein
MALRLCVSLVNAREGEPTPRPRKVHLLYKVLTRITNFAYRHLPVPIQTLQDQQREGRARYKLSKACTVGAEVTHAGQNSGLTQEVQSQPWQVSFDHCGDVLSKKEFKEMYMSAL